MEPSLRSYVVAYKQNDAAKVNWSRYRWGLMRGIAEQVAEELKLEAIEKYPFILRVSVFDLETWNFSKPTGDPVWDWRRPQPAPDTHLEAVYEGHSDVEY